MKILVINSNSNTDITGQLQTVSRNLASDGTQVDAICPNWGVPSVEGSYDAVLAAHATVELVRHHETEYDAFIIACFSDPGLFAARELTTKPVYGIAQSSMVTALSLGYKFSILSPLARFRPILENLVRLYGMESQCASVRTVEMGVSQTFTDRQQSNRAFIECGLRAIKEDGAEVICLGGAVFAGRDHEIAQELGVVCIDGLSAALKTAESNYALGYSTSKVGLFQTPKEKLRTIPWHF